ncbi:MAG: hypothetical protein AB201_00835 [Parcubacteria bacterium C7867-006]|nr:MAG: hypothetical protein AB201_00835 [Parcubacteria bacterium C7867-006]
MDIFAHGLWAGAAYKGANKKREKPLKLWQAAFWGVFPDLFAFTIPFIWLFGNLLFGGMSLADIPRPDAVEPMPQNALPIFNLASMLYSFSHSAIIFLIVFGITFLIFRRPIWELGGWFIHILLDIPTHSYQFYPTPFLWPLSGWKFDGFSWGTPWFLILNYSAIIIVYLFLRRKKIV